MDTKLKEKMKERMKEKLKEYKEKKFAFSTHLTSNFNVKKVPVIVNAVPMAYEEALSPLEWIGKLNLKINEIIEVNNFLQEQIEALPETLQPVVLAIVEDLLPEMIEEALEPVYEVLETKQDAEDETLITTSKLIVGAINEIKTIVGSGEIVPDELKRNISINLTDAINDIYEKLPLYQKKQDNTLTTTSKQVVGAINENKSNIDTLNTNKQDKTDNTLTTISKQVVGAINELNTNKQDKLTPSTAISIDTSKNISAKIDGETIITNSDNELKVNHDDTLIVGTNGLSVATDGETITHNSDEKLEVILSEEGALEKDTDGLSVKVDGVSISKNANNEIQANIPAPNTTKGIEIGSDNKLAIKVDNTSIQFDTNGKLHAIGGGSSAVDSVNGKTGIVVLKAEDIDDNDGNSIEEDLSDLNTNKQDKTDNTLTTTSKQVIGAINELNANKVKSTQTTISSVNYQVKDIQVVEEYPTTEATDTLYLKIEE